MSVVFVVLPAVSAGWPAIATAVAAVCAGLGYVSRRLEEQPAASVHSRDAVRSKVELEMANAEVIGEALAREQTIEVEKEGVIARFSRDPRGRLSLHVEGERSRDELVATGTELLNRVRQKYAVEKVKAELAKQGFVLVEEHVDAEESIRLSVRRFR